MTDEEIPLGPFLCSGTEQASAQDQVIIVFRNNMPAHGGNGIFRIADVVAAKFEEGAVYELFARKVTNGEKVTASVRKKTWNR